MKRTSRVKLVATALTVARTVTRPGAPTVLDRAQCLPRLARATADGSYTGTTPARLALVAAAAAYVASPIDLIPEAALPVLGLTDDVLVLGWAVRNLVDETDRFLVWEAARAAAREPWRPDDAVQRRHTGTRQLTSGDEGKRPRTVARDAAAGFVLERVRRRLER